MANVWAAPIVGGADLDTRTGTAVINADTGVCVVVPLAGDDAEIILGDGLTAIVPVVSLSPDVLALVAASI
jgi:hypothetical protein